MRSRKASQMEVAEVARRRLELLSAELAGIRPGPVDPPVPGGRDGPGEQPGAPVGAATSPPHPGRHARRGLTPGTALAGWLHDRLPPTLQGRVQLGASHLTVVALIVAAALAATCWWVIRADGAATGVPVAADRSRGSSATPLVTPVASAAASSRATAAPVSPSPSGTIIVDVAGKVRRPGIATLPAGARVVDALRAAGGARRGVDLGSLNLARVLSDGEQILVGVPAPPGIAASAAAAPVGTGAPPTLVNINTAGQAELETLPGVGPVTAQAILRWRSENGSFTAVDDLLEVSGIGDATLAKIAPFVTL
jgi:competence protein ComEA